MRNRITLKTIKNKIQYFQKAVRAGIFAVCSRVIALFVPLKQDRALFVSDVRGELGGNLAFVRRAMPKTIDARYDFLADRRMHRGVIHSLELFYNLATCKYILLEDYFTYISYMRVRKGQQICQLWHAAGAYKKFGYSRANGDEEIKIHSGYKKYAKAITSAEAIRGNYAEAFGLPLEKVQATGVPRTDVFFDEAYISRAKDALYARYPVLRGRKVVLFAPTYRGLRAEDAAYDFSKLVPEELYEALGDEYVFVFKWHPATYNNLKLEEKQAYSFEKYGGFFLDVSGEREINDLLLVADVLVTDYSSVIFDYYLTGKPVVFYTFDKYQYAGGRGIYYPFEEYLYGPAVETQEQLVAAIKAEDLCEEKREAFGKKFMEACDGHATERTCAWIFGDRLPGEEAAR